MFASWILKRFVPAVGGELNSKERIRCGIVCGITGIICNLLLVIVKIVLAVLSGSLAMAADAVNNLSDAGSGIITVIGFRFSSQPPDAEHPFGHGRTEYCRIDSSSADRQSGGEFSQGFSYGTFPSGKNICQYGRDNHFFGNDIGKVLDVFLLPERWQTD